MRDTRRFYYADGITEDNLTEDAELLELSAEESHHMLHVLRLSMGAQIILFDIKGLAFSAKLIDVRHGRVRVRVLKSIADSGLSLSGDYHLAVTVVKRRGMEFMIEKLSELGVGRFQPLIADRSVVEIMESSDRWRRIAISAAKQCGRNLPLQIEAPAKVDAWIARQCTLTPPKRLMFAHLIDQSSPTKKNSSTSLLEGEGPLWIAIGPEGGWSLREVEAFGSAGFQPFRMSGLTLRTETAALAAAAIASYQALFAKSQNKNEQALDEDSERDGVIFSKQPTPKKSGASDDEAPTMRVNSNWIQLAINDIVQRSQQANPQPDS